jgi:hypothetical protein
VVVGQATNNGIKADVKDAAAVNQKGVIGQATDNGAKNILVNIYF